MSEDHTKIIRDALARKRYREKHRDSIKARSQLPLAKAKRQAYLKKYYQENKEKYKVSPLKNKQNRLIREYGITLQDYNDILEEQKYSCACCGTLEKESSRPLVVDYDHNYMYAHIRGILCNKCNMALGHLGDDLQGVYRALSYIMRYMLDQDRFKNNKQEIQAREILQKLRHLMEDING